MEVCQRAAATDESDLGICDQDKISAMRFIRRDNIIDMAWYSDICVGDAEVLLLGTIEVAYGNEHQ